MRQLKTVMVSLLSGLAGMLLLWVATFLLMPGIAAEIFLWPGMMLVPVVAASIPDTIVYKLWPEGGLDASAGVVVLTAVVLWWAVGAAVAYYWLRSRRRNDDRKSP